MKLNDPLLLDLPMPIYTSRLLIRPVMTGDGKQMFSAIEESREHFEKWLPWVKVVTSWQDSERTARQFYADFIQRKAMHLALFEQERLIGMCGLNTILWKIPSASIGYWCRLSAQGQGFIREAVAALTLYAFKEAKLKRLSILCHEANVKSIQVAEKLGYRLETQAFGLIENLKGEDLEMGRHYVRFDTAGMDEKGGVAELAL